MVSPRWILLVVVILVSADAAMSRRFFSRSLHRLQRLFDAEWEEWKAAFDKSYDSERSEKIHKNTFFDNRLMITKHNRAAHNGHHTYFLRMNHLGDVAPADFSKRVNGFNMTKIRKGNLNDAEDYSRHRSGFNTVQLPTSIDWRELGAVTEVKDQGQCGSCWAFSTTGSLEGQHFKQTGRLVSLSEQNLVDCSSQFDNDGCNGGLMTNAFRYVKANHGIDTERSYPYEGHEDRCHFKKSTVGATDRGFVALPSGDIDALMEAVANVGPISVAIDASSSKFQFYSHGVYSDRDCSNVELDHGVLVVGYGVEDSIPYWLIKNSWDTMWGESGYIKIKRGGDNMCGVASQASYPLV